MKSRKESVSISILIIISMLLFVCKYQMNKKNKEEKQ